MNDELTTEHKATALHYQQQRVVDAAIAYQDRVKSLARIEQSLAQETAILRAIMAGDGDEIRAVLSVIATNGIPSWMDIVNT
jgi:hypothetical protein